MVQRAGVTLVPREKKKTFSFFLQEMERSNDRNRKNWIWMTSDY